MWIGRAISKYDFKENIDFCTILGESSGGRKATEYIVTMDMAKELAMLEDNPKGKETRKYFISFEKKGKEVIKSQSLQIQLMQEAINQLSIMDTRLTEIEQTKRLENWQEKELHDLKNRKVYEIAEKHDLKNDEAMIRKLHSRVWKAVKNRFNIPRYNELPCLKFEEGKAFMNKLTLGDLL
jgi:phage anti-repressor protein